MSAVCRPAIPAASLAAARVPKGFGHGDGGPSANLGLNTLLLFRPALRTSGVLGDERSSSFTD